MYVLAVIPSPPSNALHIGPLQLRAYGLMIALGVIVAVYWAERRWAARGGQRGDINAIALWAVPAGIVGARLYHVVTDYELYIHHAWRALAIWDGGLGIPGGIAAGVIAGLIVAHRRHLPIPALLDTVAPTLPLAQAIGRCGNWFNQELYGRPTTLPWAVHIDPAHRPAGLAQVATYHPTFLYESLWNLALVGLILLVERTHRLRPGRLFAVYVAGYALGRFFIERLRIDFAHTIAGLRINEWVSVVLFVAATIAVATGRVTTPSGPRPGPEPTSEPSTSQAGPP